MTKLAEVAKWIKKLREALDENQEQFAKRVGVTPASISLWEKGDKKHAPGPGAYLSLGTAAAKSGRHEAAIWFWKCAGLESKILLSTAGAVLNVGPRKLIEANLQDLPDKLLPEYLDEKSAGFAFAAGDIVMYAPADDPDDPDDPVDLRPFLDRIVLADFDPACPQVGFRKWWPIGKFMGHLRLEKYAQQDLSWVAKLGPLSDFTDATAHIIGTWQYPDPPASDKPADWQEAAEEARLQAPAKVRLIEGCRILGRAVAWFSGSGEKK